MEEIKIFATEISGIGITKYKDPVTEKEVEVEYKLTTNINPGKDVDVPGVDVENILKDSLTREINNDLNKRKLLSIITFAKSVGATHNIKVEKTDDVFDVTIKKSLSKFLGKPIFVTNAKVAIYLNDVLIPETQPNGGDNVYICGKIPVDVDGKLVSVDIYCDATKPFNDTHTIIYDERNPKNSLYVNYENIEFVNM